MRFFFIICIAILFNNLSFGFISSGIQRDFDSNEDIFFDGNSQMAIFEEKMPSVGLKSPEDQRDKPKTQVNNLDACCLEPPCAIVLFGGTGDLSNKKLYPSLYRLYQDQKLSENSVIIAIGRNELTQDAFKKQVQKALALPSQAEWEVFAEKLFFFPLNFNEDQGYIHLKSYLAQIDQRHGTAGNRLYYLATAPSYFGTIIEKLSTHRLIYDPNFSSWSKVVIEKPFGIDLNSAIVLQKQLSNHLDPTQIFRIDHYLGKDGVQNLFDFRFKNQTFEQLWNNQHIDNIQITLSEQIGIGSRGKFFEETGALRDLFQNHVMQILAIVAMESPTHLTAQNIHDEKIKALRAVRPFTDHTIDQYVVRGQYGPGDFAIGYRQEVDVDPESPVETYVAMQLMLDNPRWQGVPFYLRAGKRLAKQYVEITVTFKGETPKVLSIQIQPDMGIFLNDKELHDQKKFPRQDAYDKLLYQAIQGDQSLFVEAEEQLSAWMLLTPILQHWQTTYPKDFPNYPAGSKGPLAADQLLEKNGHSWESLEELLLKEAI